MGVPQGSVMGPVLWNLAYDGVLQLGLPEGAESVAFADDLAIVARSRTMEGLRRIVEEATDRVIQWMEEKGLRVAADKTKAVWLSTKRAGKSAEEKLRVGGHEVPIVKRLKYLGVIVEANPTLSGQCVAAAEAARTAEASIARILPNHGGAGEGRRRLLAAVAKAKLAYAAPVWEQAMGCKKYANKARGALRTGALRIIRGYRTVSTEAAEVLASVIPGDLYVTARAETYWGIKEGRENKEAREIALERAMERWQRRWETSTCWTRELIADVREWVGRDHGEMTHELTQLFTGHGSFEAYREKIGKGSDGICRYCKKDRDTAYHTLEVCKEWEEERMELMERLGGVRPLMAGKRMIASKSAWEAVAKFAGTVISKKYKDERKREKEESEAQAGA